VRFRISDAFLPEASELPMLTSPDERLEGTVIDFSDSGTKVRFFAVVDVVTRYAVVVPVDKLEIVQRSSRPAEKRSTKDSDR
jgi:hypothetical protein